MSEITLFYKPKQTKPFRFYICSLVKAIHLLQTIPKSKGKQFEVQLCLQGLLGGKLCLPLVVCAAEDALHTLLYNDVMHISHP